MIGTKINNLTIIGPAASYRYLTLWRGKRKCISRARVSCLCDCGVTFNAQLIMIRAGKTKHCAGCGYRTRKQSTRRDSAVLRLFKLSILNRAKKAALPVTLTLDEYETIASKPCTYCGELPYKNFYEHTVHIVPRSIRLNGIDRIDSTQGYHANNCVSCCRTCNTAKASLTKEAFLAHISRIYKCQQNL